MSIEDHYMKAPCSGCPFKKDTIKGWLGENRMAEILESDSFVCPKTTSGKILRKQCAGFMLLKKEESSFVSISGALDIDLNIKGGELIFDSKSDCIEHHKN